MATLNQVRTYLDAAINALDRLIAEQGQSAPVGQGGALTSAARQVIDAAMSGNYTPVEVKTMQGTVVVGAIRPAFFDAIQSGFRVTVPKGIFLHGPHEDLLGPDEKVLAKLAAGNGEMHQNRAALYALGVHRPEQWGRLEEIDPSEAIASSRGWADVARLMAGRAFAAASAGRDVNSWLMLNDNDSTILAYYGV